MNHPHPCFDTDTALELRVLAGPQAGARAQLPSGAPCVVAAQAAGETEPADIVLREPGTDPARARVTPRGANALLEVTQGRVTLGEQTLNAGECAVWSMHAPLHIGSSIVAFGSAAEECWPEGAPPENLDEDEERAPVAAPRPARAWLVPLGVTLAVGCAGLLGLVQVVSAEHPAPVPAVTLGDALRGSEFAALTATQDADGRAELLGRLDTLAQRTRLETWLAARQLSPLVEVQVDEALARDVVDVFRVNGVTVQARVQAAGTVVAEASEPDVGHLARAEEAVRRDVRGLQQLSVQNHAAPTPPPRPPVPDDPGKRIASVVPGEPAYLVTADGARYFVGALLPSGDRITRIDRQRVTLERDGQVTRLNL
jgi:type III secretion protein D